MTTLSRGLKHFLRKETLEMKVFSTSDDIELLH